MTMEIDITSDGHVHTRLCHHAQGEMEEYVQAAVARGLREIIFLEHLEVGITYFESTWLSEGEFQYYWTEGKRLQERYRGQLAVGLGVEVGYNPRRKRELLEFLGKYPWDRIGISYHFLEAEGRHYNVVSRKTENIEALGRMGVGRVVDAYLQGLLEAIEILPGDVLCHLDAVLRHHPEVHFTAGHCALLEEVLAALARKGMALEVNTSGFRLRQEPYPSLGLLARAVEMGISLAAGSDAHQPEEVARHFGLLPGLLE